MSVPRLRGNEQQLVKDYLNKHLDDPSGMEFVEWAEPRCVLISPELPDPLGAVVGVEESSEELASGGSKFKPGIIMLLRYRAKNKLGAKVLGESVFLIQDGKVVREHYVDEDLGSSHYWPYGLAVAHLGRVGAERTKGKVTQLIVRGKISRDGVPVDKKLRVELEVTTSNRKAFIKASVSPPNYEVAGVTPGKHSLRIQIEDKVTYVDFVATDKQEVQSFDSNVHIAD
jgi:hypothetical protein